MKMMGGFALSFGIGGLLTGCSSGEGDQAVSSSPDGETSKVLRVAMMGSATDTLDPATFSTLLPLAIALNVYDSLILLRNGVVENSLAESIESDVYKRQVVGRHAVRVELPAATASVDDGPLATLAHPHAHGLHDAAAIRGAVAWLVVGMLAGQAVRAMVAMFAARARCDDGPAAYLADEHVVACMGAVVAFLVLFSFVFPVHGMSSGIKRGLRVSSGRP